MKLPSTTQLHAYAQKVAGVVAIVLGSIHVALAGDHDPIPSWETKSFAVFIFITGALHLAGGSSLAKVAAGELGNSTSADVSSSSASDSVVAPPVADTGSALTDVGTAIAAALPVKASSAPKAPAAASAPATAAAPVGSTSTGAASGSDAPQVPTGDDGHPVAETPRA